MSAEGSTKTLEELRQEKERQQTQASLDEQELARRNMWERVKLEEERKKSASSSQSQQDNSNDKTRVLKK